MKEGKEEASESRVDGTAHERPSASLSPPCEYFAIVPPPHVRPPSLTLLHHSNDRYPSSSQAARGKADRQDNKVGGRIHTVWPCESEQV